MSIISSGTGLVSGLPTSDIIDALMAAQSRPRDLLKQRITGLQSQQTALTELNARLLALSTSVTRFGNASFFKTFSANSSNEDVLRATAGSGATPGVIDLVVRSLVTNHQLISNGFADADTTPVGAGTISLEIGNGGLVRPTPLGDLNAGAGVRRGRIEITDRAGDSAVIDLTAAVDLTEVIDAINNETDINVRASVSGNHIVIEDLNEEGTGSLKIANSNGSFAATDLGIDATSAEGLVEGRDILYLSDSTLLTRLNDGNGVRRNLGTADFSVISGGGAAFDIGLTGDLKLTTRLEVLNNGNGVRTGDTAGESLIRVTNRAGQSAEIDLYGAQTIGEVIDRLEGAVDENGESLSLTVSPAGVNFVGNLIITDNSTPREVGEEEAAPQLIIEDVNGFAAADLGIVKSTSTGSVVGNGIHRITTIGDVIRAINYADGNDGTIVASLTSNGIAIQDNSGAGTTVIQALNDGSSGLSHAAADLGFAVDSDGTLAFDASSAYETRHLLAGLNTVLLRSLNGGQGVELGRIQLTGADGTITGVDLTEAQSVQDVLDLINATTDTSGVTASINSVGNGIAIQDATGSGGAVSVAEDGGQTAQSLGIRGSGSGGRLEGENLQLQYISETTQLKKLNGGRGVRQGQIEIRTRTGALFTVNVTASQKTVGDFLRLINSTGSAYGVEASINATGDGILITDTNDGGDTLRIQDVNGNAAADLRIAGEAEEGVGQIDGSYEIKIDIDADDTLNDVAKKINDATNDVSASVINDGASASPYRLSVRSNVSGKRGAVLFDAGSVNLKVNTLVRPQDAVVLVGGSGASPIVVSSSTNTLNGVLPDVQIDLVGVSNEPTSVSVSRDIDRLVSDVDEFVTNYNAAIDRIKTLTAFDAENDVRGVLLGDSAVSLVERRLVGIVKGTFASGSPGLRTLASIGVESLNGGANDFIAENAGKLKFDEQVFRDRYAQDPDAVEQLFTEAEVGVGAVLKEALDSITDSTTGVLPRRSGVLGDQVQDLNDRIDSMNVLLDRRRSQLERQYANLESVLAGLQDQQNALAQLASLTQR